MGDGLDRRSMLKAGGLLSLGAVLAACTGTPQRAATASTSRSAPTSSRPPAPTTSAAPTPSPVDLLAGANTCTLTPATIAGDTWFDAHLVRTDIRDGRPGTPLALAFRVEHASSCAPVPNAVVDVWHCDAAGYYSGFAGVGRGDGGNRAATPDEYGDPESQPTDADRFLRGTQVTGADGVVQFLTIYPGWYPTRTTHVHLKVHLDAKTVLTGQLFFDDAITDAVYAAAPYSAHPGRDTRNDRDEFYKAAAQLKQQQDGGRWLGAIVLGVP